MQHPEQALFDEVKGLKIQMDEVRDRIFKVENTYINKVENSEKRDHISKVVESKILSYKEALKSKKLILIDGKQVPLFKDTVFTNIYQSTKLKELWDSPKIEVILDLDYEYFNAILDIVKKGHNFEILNDEDKQAVVKNFKLKNDKLSKDRVFNKYLQMFFSDNESISKIAIDYNLDYACVPSDLSNMIKNIEYNKEPLSTTEKYNLVAKKEFNSLTNPKNNLAIFMDYNSTCVIELNTSVRIKNIGLKPFTNDSNVFSPATGAYYPKLYHSNDNKDWKYVGVMPSTYGTEITEDSCSTFNLGGFTSIKFIKIVTDGSSQFSLSYLKLNQDVRKEVNSNTKNSNIRAISPVMIGRRMRKYS